MIIAIDGPAAAGKGTLARRLADRFGLALLDTGLLYRAVGAKVTSLGQDPSDTDVAVAAARDLASEDLGDEALRGDAAAEAASKVAAIPRVREVLLDFQRNFARNPPGGASGAVIDGRDIGTVVCPDAEIKFFITADVEIRAERRLKELQDRGLEAIYGRVLRDMKGRDARDSGREVAPLEPADDAHRIDTGDLDADGVFAAALGFIETQDRSG